MLSHVDEAARRAIDGVREEIYYKGKVVGEKYNYSDSLLMFLIRGAFPDKYGQGVGKGGGVNVNFGVAVLPMQAQNEAAWQDRAITVHAEQQPITLEPIEDDNTLTRGN